MKLKKLIAVLLIALMACATIPLAAIAEEVQLSMVYRKMWNDTDVIWAEIEETESEMMANGATKAEIMNALFDIAANGDGIVSCEWDNDHTFNFVHESGMINAYDWDVNNSDTATPLKDGEPSGYVESTLKTMSSASSLDVILVGPYYGIDGSFTAQYRNEAQSLANYTGGEYTLYSGTAVDADACKAMENYGIIIFDSHGSCTGGRSYLCLNSSNGFTNEDYTNNRALRSGSAAWVTGAFWEYYCPNMKASMVWMAICEGMMTDTLAIPLMNAGCAVVYGYSQSVTFVGDYIYEATFFNHMKQGETVADAKEAMVTAHGIPDPYGDAYPIFVSEVDPYPANPDAAQNVYCEWHLPTAADLIVTDATSLSFTETEFGVAPMFSHQIEAVINPEGANNFTREWTSSDPSVATVDRKGNVTGINNGTATISLTIASTENSNSDYSFTASATVTVSNEYLPVEQLYVPTTTIIPGEQYLVVCNVGTRYFAMSNEYFDENNGRSLKPTQVSLTEIDGVTAIVEGVTTDNEWSFSNANGGTIRNNQNGMYLNLAGNYLTMSDVGIDWSWAANDETNNGVLSNDASAYFKYLGCNSAATYFGVFVTSYNVQLFRKLVRDGSTPYLPGDADGNNLINTSDALLLLRHSLGIDSLDPAYIPYCDVDNDGTIGSGDALIVLRRALGLV